MWSVFFVFLSYLDRNLVKGDFPSPSLGVGDEAGEVFYMFNGTFCAKSARVGAHDLHQVSDGVEEVRSVRDPRGGLLDCAVVSSPMEVKSFMHVCRLGLRDRRRRAQPRDWESWPADVATAKARCRAFWRAKLGPGPVRASPAPQGQTAGAERGESQDVGGARTAPRRTKRGFTYPGTLWCGAGNNAEHYDHLGEFADTDSCCREHDHCPYVIQPFSSRYGYRNFRWHTICHCDCDNALKACLRKVNDTSSRVVGQAFFNVIQVPCFEFRYEEQCVERLWYGWCQRYEKVPIAVAQESVTYDFGGIEVINELTIAPPARKDEEEEGARAPATATQAPPALGHMVTAAEDFIKVLATVSTSQSTAAESAKEEREQGAEQKKNKKTSRKKNKKNKNKKKKKGKGKRRRQGITDVSKLEGVGSIPRSVSPADGSLAKSDFLEDPGRYDHKGRFAAPRDGFLDAGGRDDPFNDVMQDEPLGATPAGTRTPPPPRAVEMAAGEPVPRGAQQSNGGLPPAPPGKSTPRPPKSKRPRSKESRGKKRRKTPRNSTNPTKEGTHILV
ncbi:uncharacterized protein proca1 [Lepisosteus oculatus]|uniref:uncharacterized protein proca1 n=1 Tax=Lepisosteus oculatus TaxID=7918 RepID=UPI003720AB8D